MAKSLGVKITKTVRGARGQTDIKITIAVNGATPEIKTAIAGRLEAAAQELVDTELGINPKK